MGNEAMWDAGTTAVLARHGSSTADAVLEVGAGAGSIVRWLAAQAAPGSRVVATDLDTRFVEGLATEDGAVAVEIRQADIVTDNLEPDGYDLVHSRMVVEHLAEKERAIGHMVAGLRPGGYLIVEDLDWTAFGFDSDTDLEHRAAEAILGVMSRGGFDPKTGRHLPGLLAAQGLVAVVGEGRSMVIGVDHPGHAFFRLSFEQLVPKAVALGMLSEAEAAAAAERLRQGVARIITPTLVASIGRKPL
jgi:SAM-dependent methyltransferase